MKQPASKEQLEEKRKRIQAALGVNHPRNIAPRPAPELTPEDKRIRNNRLTLQNKTVNSTPRIDFGFLEKIGILGEFTRLTERVGFTRAFWEIPSKHPAYIEPTLEFLASLALQDLSDGTQGISFRLKGRTYRKSLVTLAEWFHFDPHQTDYLGYVPEDRVDSDASQADLRASFWFRITGQRLPRTGPQDPRVTSIIHPVLRFIGRVLALSIFSRGESSLRPRHDEFQLMATMLRRDDQLQRPHLMLLMVRYWLSILTTGKPTGIVNIGSYVTFIASKLEVDLRGEPGGVLIGTACHPGKLLDKDAFTSWSWLSTQAAQRGRPTSYKWKTELGDFRLPLQYPPIDFTRGSTWRLEEPLAAPPQQQPAQQADDVRLKDVDTELPAGAGAATARRRAATAGAGAASAGDATPTQQVPFQIQEHQWKQLCSQVQEIHAMQADTQAIVRQLKIGQTRDRGRISEIYELLSAIRAAQSGGHPVGAPDDTDAP
jgi:hypothetical protein